MEDFLIQHQSDTSSDESVLEIMGTGRRYTLKGSDTAGHFRTDLYDYLLLYEGETEPDPAAPMDLDQIIHGLALYNKDVPNKKPRSSCIRDMEDIIKFIRFTNELRDIFELTERRRYEHVVLSCVEMSRLKRIPPWVSILAFIFFIRLGIEDEGPIESDMDIELDLTGFFLDSLTAEDSSVFNILRNKLELLGVPPDAFQTIRRMNKGLLTRGFKTDPLSCIPDRKD